MTRKKSNNEILDAIQKLITYYKCVFVVIDATNNKTLGKIERIDMISNEIVLNLTYAYDQNLMERSCKYYSRISSFSPTHRIKIYPEGMKLTGHWFRLKLDVFFHNKKHCDIFDLVNHVKSFEN